MCTGQKCPEFNRCFITAMHQRAEEADLIIVNHHLFFADLAIRAGRFRRDFAGVFARWFSTRRTRSRMWPAIISGGSVSSYRFDELARDAEGNAADAAVSKRGPLRKHMMRMRERAQGFFEQFPGARRAISISGGGAAGISRAESRKRMTNWLAAVKRIETELSALTPKPEEVITLARRAAELRARVQVSARERREITCTGSSGASKGVFLAATPIDVSEILRERLFEQFDTVVLTSATLAVGGQIRFSEAAARDSGGAARSRLQSEFDFREQALLYIPRGDARRARSVVFGEARRRKLSGCWRFRRGARFACLPATCR